MVWEAHSVSWLLLAKPSTRLGAGLHLVYISNIKCFFKLKPSLSILFKSQGTTAVWGFNFLRVGVLKPFKLLKCIHAGGKKGKLFCNFSSVGSFCVNCKCAVFVRLLANYFAFVVLYFFSILFEPFQFCKSQFANQQNFQRERPLWKSANNSIMKLI